MYLHLSWNDYGGELTFQPLACLVVMWLGGGKCELTVNSEPVESQLLLVGRGHVVGPCLLNSLPIAQWYSIVVQILGGDM